MNSRFGFKVISHIHSIKRNSYTHKVVNSHSQHVKEGDQKQIVKYRRDGNAQALKLYIKYTFLKIQNAQCN